MPKKVLINGVTLEGANLVPLLLKVKYWQRRGVDVTFFGTESLQKQIDSFHILNTYSFIELKNAGKITSRFRLIFEGLRRNISALSSLNQLKHTYDVVYSISSVLDLLIFPYILKKIDKKILWVAVFDNIVPLTDPGNRFIRFLAWVFFQLSLILLRGTDYIFTGSEQLEGFLLNRNIDKNKIIERGQAVRNDLIKKAKKKSRYTIDALFIGRINETKGIYDMLSVLQLVKRKFPNFQLALIGTGEHATVQRYKKRIQEMHLVGNVRFLGYVSEKEKFDIIASSKVFWFLSVSASESWGVALLEAICCGKPAFVYNLPAYRYLKHNEAFFFSVHDYAAVAAKVIEVFEMKDFDNVKGRLLIDVYSWEKIAEIEYDSFIHGVRQVTSSRTAQKKILINGITLDGANLVPLLSKIKYWQTRGAAVTFFGNTTLQRQIDSMRMIQTYDFIELRHTREIRGRIHLIFEGIRRNIFALSSVRSLRNRYHVVYSISSVLDLLLFPFVLKKTDKTIQRVCVFDNTVPFLYSGKILINFLAWFFFRISLMLLRGADSIFVVRQELRHYLLRQGFREDRLIVTGNAIEMGFVKSAKRDASFSIDALYIGRINEMKGIYDMLDVLMFVKVRYPDFQLAIMGSGEDAIIRAYKSRIHEMGLSRNVQFLGYKTGIEKFTLIKSSRCFWFFSHTESYPLAPLEAVCCGLRTFVYDLPAYDMYKNDEVTVVRKGDYADVAEQIIRVFETRDFENKSGKTLFAHLCHSWDSIAEIEYRTFV